MPRGFSVTYEEKVPVLGLLCAWNLSCKYLDEFLPFVVQSKGYFVGRFPTNWIFHEDLFMLYCVDLFQNLSWFHLYWIIWYRNMFIFVNNTVWLFRILTFLRSEKSFKNLVKSNRNQIVFTILWLISNSKRTVSVCCS